MPGGIGPINVTTASACSGTDREIASVSTTNEIFFNLDGRRVFFDTKERFLYFVDSPDGVVAPTIVAVLKGLKSTQAIEQVYLDPHKFFTGARRVKLIDRHADTLLIALRLAGVRTTVR